MTYRSTSACRCAADTVATALGACCRVHSTNRAPACSAVIAVATMLRRCPPRRVATARRVEKGKVHKQTRVSRGQSWTRATGGEIKEQASCTGVCVCVWGGGWWRP